MNFSLQSKLLVFCTVLLHPDAVLFAQQKVDTRHTYERLYCVVPIIGKGTLEDPKRPMFAPAPLSMKPGSRTGILAYQFETSDDGKMALVEFVAADRAAFAPILADRSVKAFRKGEHKTADVETEFKQHKKNFSFEHFGVRMP